MANGHRWALVGDEMLRFLATALQENGDIHWPTVVASTSALAGEMALLSLERELPEVGTVQSRKVQEFIHDSPTGHRSLWDYIALIAEQAYGVTYDQLPPYEHVFGKAGSYLLPGHFPSLDVPPHIMPKETPMNAGPRNRKSVMAIATHHSMDHRDAAFSLATAAMKTVGFARNLGLRDMTVLVLECVVAGSRFVPLQAPVSNPAVGSISDLLPRNGAASIAPPAIAGVEHDIWGAPSRHDREEEPEEEVEDAVMAAPEPRMAFGRRR